MKLTKFTSTLLISGLVLSAAACTNSKTAKSIETTTKNTTKETVTKNGQVVSEKLSYRFAEDGCDTEVQTFTSQEEMCAGLQDEKRNNFCSLEDREKRFKELCQGTFSPFVSDSMGNINVDKHTPNTSQVSSEAPSATAPAISEKMAVKEFKTKDAGLEVFKMIADTSKSSTPSALTIISCDANPAEIATSKRNGILLLPSSKVVLTRDLNFVFKDGSSAANVQPFSTTTCAAQEGEKSVDLTTLDKNHFEIRELANAMIVYDSMVTSPEEQPQAIGGMVGIMCGDDTTYPMRSQVNGIYLTKGSAIVIKRDASSNLADGHEATTKAPYVVFTCK